MAALSACLFLVFLVSLVVRYWLASCRHGARRVLGIARRIRKESATAKDTKDTKVTKGVR